MVAETMDMVAETMDMVAETMDMVAETMLRAWFPVCVHGCPLAITFALCAP